MTQESIDPNWIGQGTDEEEIYKDNILDHYKHPHNFRELKEFTVKHREVNPVCGDEIELFIKIEDNIIEDITFSGKGCAISVAAASMLTDLLKGKPVDAINKVTNDTMMKVLGIKIGVVRMKCALLSLNTLTKAIEQLGEEHDKINHQKLTC
tara:strand:- start:814 stop:1269 length:456 start_codon:yes stop_codon:yes gene_type:complete